MIKKEGKTYEQVKALLQERGVQDTSSLEIASFSGSTDSLIILNGETVGEFERVSKQMLIYLDAEL